MNDDGYQQQLEQLKIEHRDLDDAIRALSGQPPVDQLQIDPAQKEEASAEGPYSTSGRPIGSRYYCLTIRDKFRALCEL